MSLLGKSTLDHRGKPCEPYPLRGRLFDLLPRAPLPRDVATAIRADIRAARPSAPPGTRRRAILLTIILVFIAAVLLPSLLTSSPKRWTFFALVALVLVEYASGQFYRFAHRTEIVRPFLAHRRCPSCAYDLSATAPDSDGKSTCPECGAAWNLPHAPPKESPA